MQLDTNQKIAPRATAPGPVYIMLHQANEREEDPREEKLCDRCFSLPDWEGLRFVCARHARDGDRCTCCGKPIGGMIARSA